MVTLLASEIAHEEPFGALWVTLAGGQLPAPRTRDALISPRSGARFAAQVTLCTRPDVAVISTITNEFISLHFCVTDSFRKYVLLYFYKTQFRFTL